MYVCCGSCDWVMFLRRACYTDTANRAAIALHGSWQGSQPLARAGDKRRSPESVLGWGAVASARLGMLGAY